MSNFHAFRLIVCGLFFEIQENVKADDEPYVPRKEINTALAEPTKNVTGKPVYYPPGQELFSKSEAQAALRAKVFEHKFTFIHSCSLLLEMKKKGFSQQQHK